MKKNVRLPVFLASLLAFSPGSVSATDNFVMDELALVFYALNGAAPGTFNSEYYVVNLGPVSSFRENTLNDVPVRTVNPTINSSNIAADLVSVFGAGWADDGRVRMLAVTTVTQGTPAIIGDPARTFYFSAPRNSLNTNQKGFDSSTSFPYTTSPLASGFRIPTSNQISDFIYGGVNLAIANTNPTSGANLSGVRLTSGTPNNVSTFVPPATPGLYFTLGNNPSAILGTGQLPGTAGVEAAVDIFRVLHTATGSPDLTSGSSSGNAVVGVGQFIGAITLSTNGDLKVRAVGVPPSGYDTFAAANNLTGGRNGDTDNDGNVNFLEYALLLNTAGSDGSPGTFSNGTLSFVKRAEAVSAGDVLYVIQESDDLGITDPWQDVTATTNTATEITYALPTGSPKKFARLALRSIP